MSIYNDTDLLADHALEGLVAASPHLRLLAGHRVILRHDIDEYKKKHVTIVSGGGSGHEPSHASFVGEGMLSAAVAGQIFASPSAASIFAAIKVVAGPLGVLFIVKNYTGDRLNFGQAAEMAKSQGIAVETVIVGDDCAIPRSKSKSGRRGLAGTLFVHKIAGAVASLGETLQHVYEAASIAANDIATMSFTLSPCVVPGKKPSFELPTGFMGIGVGIHGEEGIAQGQIEKADVLAVKLVDGIFNEDLAYNYFSARRVAVLVNNLGGTSQLELWIFVRSVLKTLKVRGIKVDRIYFGTFMTSLAMAGISLSLLNLDGDICTMSREMWLDTPVKVLGWTMPPQSGSLGDIGLNIPVIEPSAPPPSAISHPQLPEDPRLKAAVIAACNSIITHEATITDLDKHGGDGDCGHTLKSGAEAVLAHLHQKQLRLDKPSSLLQDVASVLAGSMGGTSGALYNLALLAAAVKAKSMDESALTNVGWGEILQAGVDAIMKYAGSAENDRTMLDVLLPVAKVLKSAPSTTTLNVLASTIISEARQGVERTKTMEARAGRASYIAAKSLQGFADAGAFAARAWIIAIVTALSAFTELV